MKQQKEMPDGIISPSPRYRYWFTPPESLTIKAADIEPFVPKANWKAPAPADLMLKIPVEKVLSKNVPRIPLRLLAELLPDHISSSDGLVKLPAAKLAAAYHLVEHKEELPPEKLPEPEIPEIPQIPEVSEKPEAVSVQPVMEPAPKEPVSTSPAEVAPSVVPPPVVLPVIPSTIPPLIPVAPKPAASNDPAPISEEPPAAAESSIKPPVIPPPPAPAPVPDASNVASSKFPPRRTGSFVGLPIFRRRPAAAAPAAVPVPPPPLQTPVPTAGIPAAIPPVENPPEQTVEPSPEPAELPVENPVSKIALPEIPLPRSIPVEEQAKSISVTVEAPSDTPASQPPPFVMEEPAPPVTPVRMLKTEHMPTQDQGQEIVEQEPLQALFLSEETMTVNRVIELCGGLPGINSCVLAHGSVVVASHNVPDGVDLVSMSANAADMLQAMRNSSARMGVGTVPAVTLHTEKGVISFFNRDDLTMLVFHKDRGFVPGVREKMAAVLGELTKARLTLPVGGEDHQPG